MSKFLFLIRDSCYLFLGIISNLLFSKNEAKIAIYSFHDLSNNDWRFSHTTEQFLAIYQLISQKRNIVAFKEIENTQNIKNKIAIFCFDDAYASVFANRHIFEKYSIPILLAVIAEGSNVNRSGIDNDFALMSHEQVRQLSQNSLFTIASHTLTHPNLCKLTTEQLDEELGKSKQILEKLIAQKVEILVYPRGKYNAAVLAVTKNLAYRYGLTMDDTILDLYHSPLLLPRIGIDQSHHLFVIKYLDSYLVILFRAYVKKIFVYIAKWFGPKYNFLFGLVS